MSESPYFSAFSAMNRDITIHMPHGSLHGQFERPAHARGLVLLARSHHAAVDSKIADNLANHGYATLGMELLTAQEAQFIDATQNVPRLTQRLIDIFDLIRHDGDMEELPLGVFANGDTTPAAIRAAAQRDNQVQALACHGGLIDRAGLQALKLLTAPLLMLFDDQDESGLIAWQRAEPYLQTAHDMHRIQMAEDPVLPVASWLSRHLRAP